MKRTQLAERTDENLIAKPVTRFIIHSGADGLDDGRLAATGSSHGVQISAGDGKIGKRYPVLTNWRARVPR